ncbi:uncharacterized [Tachysurus ichikawai]
MATLPPPRIRFALITAPEGKRQGDGEVSAHTHAATKRRRPLDRIHFVFFSKSERLNFHSNFSAVFRLR